LGFEDAVAYLDALGIDAMKAMAPSLHRIEALCAALDHPEAKAPAIHITGTNGKTSTARIATALLSAAGLKVGTYTSPHLQDVRERLALNGTPISAHDFGEVFDHIRPFIDQVERDLGETLTYFEVLTGMFFLWAAESPVDAMVVEVGLGGRWDATNVLPHAPVAVVTQIGLDHTGLLGSERETIAKEKAGIVKPGAVVVTAERTPSVLEVIAGEAGAVGADLALLGRDYDLVDNVVAVGGRLLTVRTSAATYEDLFLPLHGRHQGYNAAVALEAVTRFLPAQRLAHELVAEGLAQASVPGRLEVVRHGTDAEPPVILDVAHNPDGVSALVSSLVEAFAFDRATVVLGILGDKDHVGMLAELARIPCELVLTEPKSVRSIPLAELAAAADRAGLAHEVVPEVTAAVDAAIARALPGGLVLVTGSHYVVGDARTHLGPVG
jgi:dihydrofolate synthase/folylpolyglutamate synthase